MSDAQTTQSLLEAGPTQGVTTKKLTLITQHGTWAIIATDETGASRLVRTVTVNEVLAIAGDSHREWVLSHTRNAIATLGHQLADAVAAERAHDADTVLTGMALHKLREELAAI